MSNSICLSFKICSGERDHSRIDLRGNGVVDDESRTSNLASVIRCSISKRWSTACVLMIATVRVAALTRGEVGVGVDEWWASSVLAEMPRSLWSDMVGWANKESRVRGTQ